jgi:cytochrome c oxidase subunit IV
MGTHLQRHRLDAVALVFGLMFVLEGLAALAQQLHWVHLQGHTWFGVIVVVVALGGAAAITTAAIRDRAQPSAPAPPSTGSAS